MLEERPKEDDDDDDEPLDLLLLDPHELVNELAHELSWAVAGFADALAWPDAESSQLPC